MLKRRYLRGRVAAARLDRYFDDAALKKMGVLSRLRRGRRRCEAAQRKDTTT
jgi:hypothetical protein